MFVYTNQSNWAWPLLFAIQAHISFQARPPFPQDLSFKELQVVQCLKRTVKLTKADRIVLFSDMNLMTLYMEVLMA